MSRRLRLAESAPWNGGYSSSAVERWGLGEVRTVDDALASYLTSTFPEHFVEVRDDDALDTLLAKAEVELATWVELGADPAAAAAHVGLPASEPAPAKPRKPTRKG